MILYFLSIIGFVIFAVICQYLVPTVSYLHDAKILFLPLIFLCTSVTLNTPTMLLLAFLCGFIWDAQNVLGGHGGDVGVYSQVPESLRFGYSILLYAAMGFLMLGVQPLFRRGKWQISVIVSAIATFLYLAAEYLLINFVRGDFIFSHPTLMKILYSSLITMIFSPLVFKVLFQLASACGYKIRFEGLIKRRRLILD